MSRAERLREAARSFASGEEVLAAAVFQPAGTSGARLRGGELAARRQRRALEGEAGIPLTKYMLVAVTPRRVLLLRARSGLRWQATEILGAWDRSELRVEHGKGLSGQRITLTGSDGGSLELDALRGRPGCDEVVAELTSTA